MENELSMYNVPSFVKDEYKSIQIPDTKEDYITSYLNIVNIINNKVIEINNSNLFFETLGMISISDINFINSVLDVEEKASNNLKDIDKYRQDLLSLRMSYMDTYSEIMTLDPRVKSSKILDFEYYTTIDNFWALSKQFIYVAEYEIISLFDKGGLSYKDRIILLFRLVANIYSMTRRRLTFESKKNSINVDEWISSLKNPNQDFMNKLNEIKYIIENN